MCVTNDPELLNGDVLLNASLHASLHASLRASLRASPHELLHETLHSVIHETLYSVMSTKKNAECVQLSTYWRGATQGGMNATDD
jgi:hypothetical protein